MNLPQINNAEKFQGLYVIDFGEYSSVGFTAGEVAELLESEKFSHVKVYKIYKAYQDGKMELKAVSHSLFNLEKGIFFYSFDEKSARKDYKGLVSVAVSKAPPCRAKVHLAKYSDAKFVTAIVYPAEYDDQVSDWLLEADYKSSGPAQGGAEAVELYYRDKPDVLKHHQLFADELVESKNTEQLLADINKPLQRFAG